MFVGDFANGGANRERVAASGFIQSMIAIYFWLACAVAVLGGTCYWFGTARHGPKKDSERLGLLLLYVLLGLVTAFLGGIFWFGWRAFQGFNPH